MDGRLLKITGELDVDLRSNIAAEARAKIVYERLINFCEDPGTKDALQFLMTREITHMMAFTAALESMGKDRFTIGKIAPTAGLVDPHFNDSTGAGDRDNTDARGPWNQGGNWEYVQAPAFQEFKSEKQGTRTTNALATLADAVGEGTQSEQPEKKKAGSVRVTDPSHRNRVHEPSEGD